MIGQPVNYLRVVPVVALTIGLLAVLLWADWYWGLAFNSSVVYGPLLLVCAFSRDRRVLWPVTALTILATIAGYFFEQGDFRSFLNRGLSVLSILAVAGVLHALIKTWRVLERDQVIITERAGELERANRELRLRESDIASQNEELQSQTEELERQSEELRVANDELAQRERTLETLLSLSRSLGMDLTPSETMNRICETLGQLVNGPATATAILMREGDDFVVRCHYGFGPEGVQQERIPAGEAFAQLVCEQKRTGYLEDVTLRPDLKVPQPASGEAVVSVLASPLIVRGRAIGVIEVYGRQKKSWSDDQIALAESLAAQAAISLENAELFAEIGAERTRLRAVLDTVPFGVAICDDACHTMLINPAGAAMLHVPANTRLAPMATDARWTTYRDGERITPEQQPLIRAVQRGEQVEGDELELIFPNGRHLFVLASGAPIRDDEEGKITGGVVAWADITVQKALQRELDLRRRDAEEASVRKTRFLAAASHDIRTPANAISLIAELIKRTADNPALAAEIPDLAQEMHTSAMSLVNLVTNVLDVTRFETGKLDIHEAEFPLAPLLEEEVRQTLPLAQAKGLEYELEEPPTSLWLVTDRVKLGRVIGNLLGNAIKFTDKGAVRISARRLEGGGAEIEVTDTGVGISAENQGKIFDEFFQLFDPQRSRGSGLGLAISKRLVEAMGGTLSVSSAVGKGSTFTVTLPPSCVARRDEPARATPTERA